MGLRLPLFLLASSVTVLAQSWPTFFSAYQDGLAAQAQGDHTLAVRAFARAIALNPQPGLRVKTYGLNFQPTYFPYLRRAESQLALGDLAGAETSLRESAARALEPPAEREVLAARLKHLQEAAKPSKPDSGQASDPPRPAAPVPSQVPTSAPVQVSPWLQPAPAAEPEAKDRAVPGAKAAGSPWVAVQPASPPRIDPQKGAASVSEARPDPVASSGAVPSSGPVPVPGTPAPARHSGWAWAGALLAGLAALGAWIWSRRPRSAGKPQAQATVVLPRPSFTTLTTGADHALDSSAWQDPNLGRPFGPFTAQRLLGQGGCATAYFGIHRETGLEVAIKVPHPHLLRDAEFKARFHREASLGSLLDHPKIVPILDPGPTEGDPWLVMRYIQGTTLDAHLAARGPLEVQEAVRIGSDVAEAIAFAHSRAVVHRDLKPANIMITPESALVMDFGIARVLDVSMTVNTMFIGTPLYSAPECVVTPRVGPAADRYALGIILFELLTGAPPFSGDSPFQILEAQRSHPLPELGTLRPGVPPRLNRLIQRLCAKAPEDRPEDGEMLAILAELKVASTAPGA